MRNLTLHHQSIHNLDGVERIVVGSEEILQPNIISCIDPNNENIYILKSNKLYQIIIGEQLEVLTFEVIVGNNENVIPIGIEYCSDENILYCAYESGDLVKVTLRPFRQELVTHIDDGLRCIQLSPDQEILVSITNNDSIIVMMSNHEVISQSNLNTKNFGEKQFVTAGWGHKETQFHGSEGKAAAKLKSEIVARTEKDTGLPSITWRGDGRMFAVSFFDTTDNARKFKVFNREGVLQFTSELTNGLEENIAWKPSGNLIATTQLLPNKHVVALFEKNGLRHRDFSIPFGVNEVDVINLTWSPDSDILAIWCKKTNSKETFLQLYTENNYHWYLKQTIEFTAENPLIHYKWSTKLNVGKCLTLLTAEKLTVCSFVWTIDHTRGQHSDDKAVVGVIDGDKILLTAFKLGIVPPPMCHQSLQLNHAINECIFAPNSKSDTWHGPNSFLCLLQNNTLALCILDHGDVLQYECTGYYEIEWNTAVKVSDDAFPYSMHHFLWLKEDVILCSASSETHSYLCVITLENLNTNNIRIVVRETIMMEDHIHHIVHSPEVNIAYLIAGNNVFKYIHDEGLIMTEISIPRECDRVEVVKIEKRHVIIALDSRNCLTFDGVTVANTITSLCIHPHFLLLTTLQHALISVTINDAGFGQLSMSNLSVESWMKDYTGKEPSGLCLRRLERASRLVTVCPEDAKCVLQMPRGNLETIQPRALSFVSIKTHLDSLNYLAAFDIMRKQRINLNIIYDHDPGLFIANAEKFIDDIKNPSWLNLFISELQEEDVTETVYKSFYNQQNDEFRGEFDRPEEGKVQFICHLLREIMEKNVSSRNFVQPILTCLVKNNRVAGLEAALRKIKQYRMGESTVEGRQESAEEALKYLLYLIDVNMLFDISLGMYDLELTKFIGSKSQKDPKEYIPYLKNLAEMEENYRKFVIDNDLKRYESALSHIAKCPDRFNECIEVVCQHNLYTEAIKLFSRGTDHYIEIARIFGHHLARNKKYREAAIMYERSNDLDHALQMYKKCGSWQDAILVSAKINMPPIELNEMYRELVTQMHEDRRYHDAAEIALMYLEQPEEAVSLLCEGKEWREALRIAYSSKRLDLIETHVKTGIHEQGSDIYSRIMKNKEEFLKYRKRLAVVRKANEEKRTQALHTFGNIDENINRGFSDLLSDTSSVAGSMTSLGSSSSRSSGRSYRSSKNRRKQERKVLSIKEGSAFEDLALIRALHVIMTTTYTQREEVSSVNRLLLSFYHDDLAEKLQKALMDTLDVFEKYKHEIWPKNLCNLCARGIHDDNDINCMPHSLLESKFSYPPETSASNWTLDIFSLSVTSSNNKNM